jgi:hypothetical protein
MTVYKICRKPYGIKKAAFFNEAFLDETRQPFRQ